MGLLAFALGATGAIEAYAQSSAVFLLYDADEGADNAMIAKGVTFLKGARNDDVFRVAAPPLSSDPARRDELVAQLTAHLEKNDSVDILIFKHTNADHELIEKIPPALRSRIRLVYNSGCRNANEATTYLRLGVGTYVGHPGDSCSPFFAVDFLASLTSGKTIRESVDKGNAAVESILGDSTSQGSLIKMLAMMNGQTPAQMIEDCLKRIQLAGQDDARATALKNTLAKLFTSDQGSLYPSCPLRRGSDWMALLPGFSPTAIFDATDPARL